jgi:hypothetical protein
MEQLKKTNPYLYKMAPSRGGTALPDSKFQAIFAAVFMVAIYAWVIDPPMTQEQED